MEHLKYFFTSRENFYDQGFSNNISNCSFSVTLTLVVTLLDTFTSGLNTSHYVYMEGGGKSNYVDFFYEILDYFWQFTCSIYEKKKIQENILEFL